MDLVARSRHQLSLSDIARELNIARSTAHTICHTLVSLELLIRRNDQTFQMGPHVMRWSNAFTTQSAAMNMPHGDKLRGSCEAPSSMRAAAEASCSGWERTVGAPTPSAVAEGAASDCNDVPPAAEGAGSAAGAGAFSDGREAEFSDKDGGAAPS